MRISSLCQCSDLFRYEIAKAVEKRMPLLCLSKSQDTEGMESLLFRLVVLLFVRFGLPGKTKRSKASYTNLFSILLANRVFQTFLGTFTKTVNFTFPHCYLLIKINRRAATNALLMSLYFLKKKKILNTFGYVIFLDAGCKFLHA